MLQVRLTRDVRPWRCGDEPPLPDDLARRLVESGDAADPRPWPPKAETSPNSARRPAIRGLPRK